MDGGTFQLSNYQLNQITTIEEHSASVNVWLQEASKQLIYGWGIRLLGFFSLTNFKKKIIPSSIKLLLTELPIMTTPQKITTKKYHDMPYTMQSYLGSLYKEINSDVLNKIHNHSSFLPLSLKGNLCRF